MFNLYSLLSRFGDLSLSTESFEMKNGFFLKRSQRSKLLLIWLIANKVELCQYYQNLPERR